MMVRSIQIMRAFLKEEATGFEDKLNDNCEKKREPKIIPRFWPEQLER